MCSNSLTESCVSCFVQVISPSAVSLLYISVCPWLKAPIYMLLCVCMRAYVRMCANLHVCKNSSVLPCSNLCFYCKLICKKMVAIFWSLLRKNVNVSLLYVLFISFMEVTKCMWRIKLSVLLWRACQSLDDGAVCSEVHKCENMWRNICQMMNRNWKGRHCRLCCFWTYIQ